MEDMYVSNTDVSIQSKRCINPPACQEDALDTKRENLPDAGLAASNCPVVDS